MTEIWQTATVDDGYEVSNEGRVRSKDRMVSQKASGRAGAYERLLPGRMLKAFISSKTGYLQVSLSNRARHSVHRLVAMEFCDGLQDGLVVNHKNGVRTDNRAENLEWVSPQENIAHSYRELGRAGSMRGKFSDSHNTSKCITSTDIKTGEVRRYSSAMDAVREGFDSSGISRCCNGRSASHKGRYWRFSEEGEA